MLMLGSMGSAAASKPQYLQLEQSGNQRQQPSPHMLL